MIRRADRNGAVEDGTLSASGRGPLVSALDHQDVGSEEEAVCEAFSKDWTSAASSSDFHESLERAALRHVPSGARVLEVGVGPGYVPRRLARERGCRATGLDYLPAALESARSQAGAGEPRLDLVRGSAFSLPFAEASFDAVMSFGLVEHYDSLGSRRILAEHRRVCRPGGLVLVSTPSSLDIAHSLRRRWLGRAYPHHPERSYHPWSLGRELRKVGLELLASDGYAPLWGLRQARLAYPFTALLYKIGVLDRLGQSANPTLLAWLGGFTLQVARRPSS